MKNMMGISVLGIALRPVKEGPMAQVDQAQATVESGLVGDHGRSARRGVTLLANGQWREVRRELGVDLPWHTRRANILVDADSLGPWIGRTISIGEVIVEVLGENDPCPKMDRQFMGLRKALQPACRGGVYGRVVKSGVIRIGDVITIQGEDTATESPA